MIGKRTYNQQELNAYFSRIALPSRHQKQDVSSWRPQEQLQYLGLLQKHQLMTVPFENLDLHYSWNRVIHLGADHLFRKIVLSPGRGGYCMENNSLFHFVLLSLGFKAYMVSARVYDSAKSSYGGFTHCLNIVRIGDLSYGVDVCFGSHVPVHPFKLTEGLVQQHLPPGQLRLRCDSLPGGLSAQKLWIYEQRITDTSTWSPFYCFADFEILPPDLAVMNLWPSKQPSSFFTYKVMLVRFTTEDEFYYPSLDEELNTPPIPGARAGDIDGQLILDGHTMKWRKQGIKQWEIVFKSETERIQALKTWFNISLCTDEQNAVLGTAAAIC